MSDPVTEVVISRGEAPRVVELTDEQKRQREADNAEVMKEVGRRQQEETQLNELGTAITARLAELQKDIDVLKNPAVTLTVAQLRPGLVRIDQAIIDLVKLLATQGVIKVTK